MLNDLFDNPKIDLSRITCHSGGAVGADNREWSLKQLIDNDKIMSGIYNIADDSPLSTNQLISLIAINNNKKALLIGINYIKSPRNALRGCINDVINMKNLINVFYHKINMIQIEG